MAARPFFGKIMFYIWLAAMTTDAVAGVFRFALAAVGLVWISYIPKALVIGIALLGLFRPNQAIVPVASILILTLAAAVGVGNGLPLAQIFSGFAVFVPLIFGAQCYPYFDYHRRAVVKWSLIILATSCFGVLLSYFISVPWSELSYNVGDVAVQGVRSWSYAGVNRPPGFTRASVAAATFIMLFGCFLYPIVWRQRPFWALFLAIVAIACTVVSTTKGAVAAMVFAILVFSMPRKLYGVLGWIFVVVIIALPVSSVMVSYSLGFDNPVVAFLTLSFDERLTNTWPRAMNILWDYGIPFLGRGLGGVGSSAQLFGDSSGVVAGAAVIDNISVYMYGHFGLLGVIIFFYMMRSAIKLMRRKDPFDQGLGLSLLALLISGLSMDFIEAFPATIAVGTSLAAAARRLQQAPGTSRARASAGVQVVQEMQHE